MNKKIAEGKTLGLKYEIYDNTGIVEQIEFSKDMLITQSPQEYMVHLPTFDGGTSLPKRRQHIRLQGDSNPIEMDGTAVADNSGQQLTLFLLTQRQGKKGTYFGSVNHSTSKTTDNPDLMRDELFPWTSFWMMLGLSLVAAFLYQLTGQDRTVLHSLLVTAFSIPAIFLPLYVIGWWVGLIRTIAVRQNREFRAYAKTLSQRMQGNSPEMA